MDNDDTMTWEQLFQAFTEARKKVRKQKKTIANLKDQLRTQTLKADASRRRNLDLSADMAGLRVKARDLENVLMAYGFRFVKDTGWIHTTWQRTVEWPEPHKPADEVVRMPLYYEGNLDGRPPIYLDEPNTRARLGLKKADDGS